MKRIFLLFILINIFGALAIAKENEDIIDQQDELKRIESDMNKTNRRLDSLKALEGKINNEVLDSEQKIQTDKKVLRRLNNELKKLQAEIAHTEDSLENRKLQLELTRRRFLGNLRQFYLTTHRPSQIFTNDPNEALVLNRQKIYLASVAEFEYGTVELAKTYLTETEQQINELSSEKDEFDKAHRKKVTSISLEETKKTKKERDLATIQRKKQETADRLMDLRSMAQEVASIIERLQEEAAARIAQNEIDGGSSFFITLKGKLLPPYKGKIIDSYGHSVDSRNIKRFSSGISIQGQPGSDVKAVGSGTVAYVGNLRGYGNFIIINHDDKYFTTYAGLGKTFVSMNEYVLAGNKLAESDTEGIVKFELREGRSPLDPIEWIRIGSY